MFKLRQEDTPLTEAINRVHLRMTTVNVGSQEYALMLGQLAELYALKEDPSKSRISPDALVAAGASILGILIIVGHERAHVVTSKAVSFLIKAR